MKTVKRAPAGVAAPLRVVPGAEQAGRERSRRLFERSLRDSIEEERTGEIVEPRAEPLDDRGALAQRSKRSESALQVSRKSAVAGRRASRTRTRCGSRFAIAR